MTRWSVHRLIATTARGALPVALTLLALGLACVNVLALALPSGEPVPAKAPLPPALPAPPAPPSAWEGEILLKVGLATDLEQVELPCCLEPLYLATAERRFRVRGALVVRADAETLRRGVYRLQVAALEDEVQAAELATRLEADSGYPANAHFDAGVGLYRVRVGAFPHREAAESARRRLAVFGVTSAWVVSEGGRLAADAGFRLDPLSSEASAVHVAGRWLAVSQPGETVRFGGRQYRGRLLLFLNDRGRVNVINQLPLEDYLRSVVPSEMGPELYDRLEALKAQTVAARTYMLRNRGEFRREGYDICATPRCQVYRGMAAEHPLSDRAVAETGGQVLLFDGELIDARYSATCGGHTEDVGVVFPLIAEEPYLKGVPCAESGPTSLGSGRGAGLAAAVTRRLLPAPAGSSVARLEARLEGLASRASLPTPRDRLGSLERGEVRRFVASLFDLALEPRWLLEGSELARRLADPAVEWGAEEERRARLIAASGLLEGSAGEELAEEEVERMLLALGRLLGVIEERQAHFLALETEAQGSRLRLRDADGAVRLHPLVARAATFEAVGEQLVASPLSLVAGDRLRLVLAAGQVLAVVQETTGRLPARRSPYARWTRFRADRELARLVTERFPGLGFESFEILSRGVSGRVGKVRIHGEEGRSVEVEGLAVRWTFDVPDTRFRARRATARDGRTGWIFTGSGWGHGVGLCQLGSFNLAARGVDYREILHHYYTGVALARLHAGRSRPGILTGRAGRPAVTR